jgi:hypothetical protein
LEDIPEVKIVCNADIHSDDLKIAQLREARMLGRWNEQAAMICSAYCPTPSRTSGSRTWKTWARRWTSTSAPGKLPPASISSTMGPPRQDWRDCARVLSRRDFVALMSIAWTG